MYNIDMSNKVLEHIAWKYAPVKKRVKASMEGRILEYKAKTIKQEKEKKGIKKEPKAGIQSIIDSLTLYPYQIMS